MDWGRKLIMKKEMEVNGGKVYWKERASKFHTGTPMADIILRPPAFSPALPPWQTTSAKCSSTVRCLRLFPSIFPICLSCSFSLSFPSNSFVFVAVPFFFNALIVVLSVCRVVYLWPSFYSLIFFFFLYSVAFIFINSIC